MEVDTFVVISSSWSLHWSLHHVSRWSRSDCRSAWSSALVSVICIDIYYWIIEVVDIIILKTTEEVRDEEPLPVLAFL